jgi:hypothetical protein
VLATAYLGKGDYSVGPRWSPQQMLAGQPDDRLGCVPPILEDQLVACRRAERMGGAGLKVGEGEQDMLAGQAGREAGEG